jgi:hypothetical protein
MNRPLTAAIAALGIGLPAAALADSPQIPRMDHNRPVFCARDTLNEVWRIQCNPATKVCLYAENDELAAPSGNVSSKQRVRTKPLERARSCEVDESVDRAKLEAQGYTFVLGRVDAPYGWERDERGRVFQVNFNLRNRLFFGAGWTPQKILDNPRQAKRTSAEFGFGFDVLDDGVTPTRHRFRFLQGGVHVEPFSSEITLAHWDVSRRFLDPLLRITTFVGKPQRHDLRVNLGMWTEVGGLEIHPAGTGHSTIWKHAAGQGTLDLWQSPDLNSFVRVRSGIGIEGQHTDATGYRSAIVPASAFEIDAVLDDDGFHNVKFEFTHEAPRYFIPLENGQKFAQRLKAKISYEAILIAINDQPLSFKIAAGGEKRSDIFGVPDQWAFVADAGLRFSLWAPPRDPIQRAASTP